MRFKRSKVELIEFTWWEIPVYVETGSNSLTHYTYLDGRLQDHYVAVVGEGNTWGDVKFLRRAILRFDRDEVGLWIEHLALLCQFVAAEDATDWHPERPPLSFQQRLYMALFASTGIRYLEPAIRPQVSPALHEALQSGVRNLQGARRSDYEHVDAWGWNWHLVRLIDLWFPGFSYEHGEHGESPSWRYRNQNRAFLTLLTWLISSGETGDPTSLPAELQDEIVGLRSLFWPHDNWAGSDSVDVLGDDQSQQSPVLAWNDQGSYTLANEVVPRHKHVDADNILRGLYCESGGNLDGIEGLESALLYLRSMSATEMGRWLELLALLCTMTAAFDSQRHYEDGLSFHQKAYLVFNASTATWALEPKFRFTVSDTLRNAVIDGIDRFPRIRPSDYEAAGMEGDYAPLVCCIDLWFPNSPYLDEIHGVEPRTTRARNQSRLFRALTFWVLNGGQSAKDQTSRVEHVNELGQMTYEFWPPTDWFG